MLLGLLRVKPDAARVRLAKDGLCSCKTACMKKKAEDVLFRRNAGVVAMHARRGCRTYRTGAAWLGSFLLRDTSCCWVSTRSCASV